jgi:hypothetical protein
MDKKTAITMIVDALFNIAVVIVNALGFTGVASILEQILPEVNILLVAVMALFIRQEWVRMHG